MIMAGLVDSGTQNIPLGLGFLHLGVGFLSAAALTPNLPALEARGGGGGYSVWKRVPTAVRPPRSCGCSDPRWLKKGGCSLIIFDKRGAVRVFAFNFFKLNNNCMHSNLFLNISKR